MPRKPPSDSTAYAILPLRTSSMMSEILPMSSPSDETTWVSSSVAAAITSGPGPSPVPLPTIFAPPLRGAVPCRFNVLMMSSTCNRGGLDSVKQDVRFTDKHLGRSVEVIVLRQDGMVVAPFGLSVGN
ncbi:hypothetical protein LMG27174_06801 [Paraburkholderia rhynchosiae]|uniref:Uncharacterized protein n=1 Tax=Paraburkholderia rhynchosiae TaxID=487049 RepID=A0A6J5CPR8_9BURK|nr:hypothetical protein LMG27174_06801 [Paraburkholderia rhynchosiae]